MEDAFLDPYQRLDGVVGIERDLEPTLIEARYRRPQLGHPNIRGISMGRGIEGRVAQRLHHVIRSRQVGVSHAERNYVRTLAHGFGHLAIDLGE
jgi:hypothetical protein